MIDEAYSLDSSGDSGSSGQTANPFKTAVIDTLVAEVQSVAGDDRAVILVGYTAPMEKLFQNANPGLKRRFDMEAPFMFEDFDGEALRKVLELKLRQADLVATADAKRVALENLQRARLRPNFGNGGEVDNVLGKAKQRLVARMRSRPASSPSLQPQDFDPDFERDQSAEERIRELFKDVVDSEEILTQLLKYQRAARRLRRLGRSPTDVIPTTFAFKGPPGAFSLAVSLRLADQTLLQARARRQRRERWGRSTTTWASWARQRFSSARPTSSWASTLARRVPRPRPCSARLSAASCSSTRRIACATRPLVARLSTRLSLC